ncbi:hypothetical protein [Oligella sp. MSHR50489EDL]|uniref:hypothetical protein n=1 Tax=Oligella sp. MSHR50489EDL TaxID=3139409 RepID=UPI003D817926
MIKAKDLDDAKNLAEENKVFQGTVLTISPADRQEYILAYKHDSEEWYDCTREESLSFEHRHDPEPEMVM